jgi:hypothetical protein
VTLITVQNGRRHGHSFNIEPYGEIAKKSSPLKPVSQFKVNMAWMILG